MDGAVSKPFYPATLRRALLEVRTGAYQGFNPNTKKDENKGEVHGSNSIAAGDATGGFVGRSSATSAKRVEGTRSSAA